MHIFQGSGSVAYCRKRQFVKPVNCRRKLPAQVSQREKSSGILPGAGSSLVINLVLDITDNALPDEEALVPGWEEQVGANNSTESGNQTMSRAV